MKSTIKISLQCFVLTEVLSLVFVLVLQQIKPDAYRSIFHNSLEPDILNQILKTLHGFYIKWVFKDAQRKKSKRELVLLYINIGLVQEWSTSHHAGDPQESSKREALRHGCHVHVVPREERSSLFGLLLQMASTFHSHIPSYF